jgi:serine/threonine protein phosphatase PrpC
LPVDHQPTQTNVPLAWLDGVEHFEPHAIALGALPHRLVLATDGVAGSLSLDAIADIARAQPPAEAAITLVLQARAAGSQDDATAIVFSSLIETEAREEQATTVVPLNSRGSAP